MLLSNLTASSTACAILLSMNISIIIDSSFPNSYYPTQSRCGTCPAPDPYPSGEAREALALPLLVDACIQGAQVDESGDRSKRLRKGDLHFLASVFANLTTVSSFDRFLRRTTLIRLTVSVPDRSCFFLHPPPLEPRATRLASRIPISKTCRLHRAQGYNSEGWGRFYHQVGMVPCSRFLILTHEPEIAHSTRPAIAPF